jgi:hypothetical protein
MPATTADHGYRVADRVVNLRPIGESAGLPTLRFTRAAEYWAQFPFGSQVTIPLARGRLGRWQLDHFDPPIFEVYERRVPK